MKTILILFDTLIRDALPFYGGTAETPNMARLAARGCVWDNHWAGSLPCMPARRDLFTGRIGFLECPWGPLEPYDPNMVKALRTNGVYTHMITDHYHYFESSGEHYCQSFDTWDFIRGQEFDKWAGSVGRRDFVHPCDAGYEDAVSRRAEAGGAKAYGSYSTQYELNRRRFEDEGFPCERVFHAAADWVDENHSRDDWFLMVECFDPHEPFDAPTEFLPPNERGAAEFSWPSYCEVTEPPEAVARLRQRYLANLRYADACLGALLDRLDAHELWKDALVILTTDHGHMLGEHGFTGKNVMPIYNEIASLPLITCLPGGARAGERRRALTQTHDLLPTALSFLGITPPAGVRGESLLPLMEDPERSIRDFALYGVFGENVNLTDGAYTYFRAHRHPDNRPLYLYSATPSVYGGKWGDEAAFRQIVTGRFLNWTAHPVFRVPVDRLWLDEVFKRSSGEDQLYSLKDDKAQAVNLAGSTIERRYESLMTRALIEYGAPEEQFERLGLDQVGLPQQSIFTISHTKKEPPTRPKTRSPSRQS